MANFYLGCFIIGFALTAISFLTGLAGHSFGHTGDLGHGGDAGAHGGDAGHGLDGEDVGGDSPKNLLHRVSGPSWFNFGTLTGFLTWFGGIGFLMTAYSHAVTVLTILIALAGGITGGGIIFLFMAKVLAPDQVPMDPADYYMPGTLCRVTVTIPVHGTGEVVYAKGGSRKTSAACGVEGQGISKGTEVVVMRYDRGIAFVRPWDHFAEEHPGGRPT